jgi:hypothetical protein
LRESAGNFATLAAIRLASSSVGSLCEVNAQLGMNVKLAVGDNSFCCLIQVKVMHSIVCFELWSAA